MQRRLALSVWVLTIGGLVLTAGIASSEPAPTGAGHASPTEVRGLDLWPVVVRDARAVAGLRRTRILGPLFEAWRHEPLPADDSAIRGGWTLRPGLARVEREAGTDLEFLYPLGNWRRRSDRTRLRLSPFFDRVDRPEPAPGEARAREGWTALLAFGGRSDTGERYGGLFPLGGVAKQRFGRERIDFLLFPLWGRSRDESGFTRTHLLWPFFSWGSGGGRRMLRIWPFYGHDLRDGEWDRRFALWPVFHRRIEKPGTPGERRIRLALPFWGETRTDHSSSRFIGGPLYTRSENRRSGASSLGIAWPFYYRAHHPGATVEHELRVEPFLRRQTGAGFRRTAALFGLLDHRVADRDGVRSESWRVLFGNRFEGREGPLPGERFARREMWPLFRWQERVVAAPDHGTVPAEGRFAAPWLLPVTGAGFDRHVGGLLTLAESSWARGEERSDLLWGLARRRRSTDHAVDAVSWLFRRERGAERDRLWILGIPIPLGGR